MVNPYIGRIGWPELILVLVILIFIFGAGRLKSIMKGLGESVREFKSATSEEPVSSSNKKEEDTIIEAAQKLGIETEGKSVDEVLKEMAQKVES